MLFGFLSPLHSSSSGCRMEASTYGGYLHIYRIRSSGQPRRGGTSACGLREWLKSPHLKKQLVTKCCTGPRTNSLERLRQQKMNMRFGTWNVSILYRTSSLEMVASELTKYSTSRLVVVQEVTCCWCGRDEKCILKFGRKT